uniref:Uncharacterized protein n=1 Tax=Anguilla anguilla TaxID=7936 RepID=A0A0E9WAA2_ANGAN
MVARLRLFVPVKSSGDPSQCSCLPVECTVLSAFVLGIPDCFPSTKVL